MKEVEQEFKKNHPSATSMKYDDRDYYHNRGARREIRTCQNQQIGKSTYNYRARVGKFSNFWRTDFGIILADKNGSVAKSLDVFTSPMHPWNDLIKNMDWTPESIWDK